VEPTASAPSHTYNNINQLERNISEQTQVAPNISYSSHPSSNDLEGGGALLSMQQGHELFITVKIRIKWRTMDCSRITYFRFPPIFSIIPYFPNVCSIAHSTFKIIYCIFHF
jgi:hypothetical protein